MKNKFEIIEDHFTFCILKVNGNIVGRYCYDDAVEIISFIYRMKQKMEAKTGLHPEISFNNSVLTLSTELHEFYFNVSTLMFEDVQKSVETELEKYLDSYADKHRTCQFVAGTTETRSAYKGSLSQ